MDPESKQMLQDTLLLVEKNNKMLQKMKRIQDIAMFLRASYWLVVIGIALGAFYFLQPYMEEIKGFTQLLK